MTLQTPNITGDTVSSTNALTVRTVTVLTLIELCELFYVHIGVHVTLDSLMKDTDLKSTIKNLVSSSGRSVPTNAADEDNNKIQGEVIGNGSTKPNPNP